MVSPVEAKAMAARPVPVSFTGAPPRRVRFACVARSPQPTPNPHAFVGPAPRAVADAMAFTGPAPETVNGRIAMLGFVAAAGAELSGNGARAAAPLSSRRDAARCVWRFLARR